MLITTLDITDLVHNSKALCCQSGNHQSCPGTKIRCIDLGSGKAVHTADDGHVALYLDASAHACQLIHIFKAVFKNALCHNAGSLSQRQGNRHLWLHICRESRIWKGIDVGVSLFWLANHTDSIVKLHYLTANLQ